MDWLLFYAAVRNFLNFRVDVMAKNHINKRWLIAKLYAKKMDTYQ